MRLAELQRAFQCRVLHGDRAIESVVPQFAGAVDAPTRAATLLQRWVCDEWIVGIELPTGGEMPSDLTGPGQSE